MPFSHSSHFAYPFRVYYEDTDALGVVYYANYLKFMERARTEWLRACGFELDVLQSQYGIAFVVHEAALKYLKPACFNQQLYVTVEVIEQSNLQLKCKQVVYLVKQDAPDELLVAGDISLVCVNAVTFRPHRIPAIIKEVITRGN